MSVREKLNERFPETFKDVGAAELGHVYCDEFRDGVRFCILRGPGSLCAYVGVPVSHPLAGHDYDDLPVSAHGGLTYGGTGVHGDGETYWYGWDYNHLGDAPAYDFASLLSRSPGRDWAGDEHGWTPVEVYEDSWKTLYEFKQLVTLAEQIARKGWQE